VVECSGLENRRPFTRSVGSNPTPSANDQGRSVALSTSALAILRALHKTRRVDTDRVFIGRNGRAAFPRNSFLKAIERAGLEDFRFHDLRHTFASYLLMSGASLAESAEALGHKTLAMVKRYAHLSRAHAATVVNRMDARLREDGFG